MSAERVSPQSLSPTFVDTLDFPDYRFPAPGPAETSDTTERDIDRAIRSMLLAGASCEEVLYMVKTHRDSKEVGILRDLDTMSEVQTEVLEDKVHAIQLLIRSTIESPMSLEPEVSEDTPDEGAGSSSQDTDHANNPPEGNMTRPTNDNPRGCPYNGWKCKEKKGNARWRSKLALFKHYKAHHLDKIRKGDRIVCPVSECAHTPFPGDGSGFIKHLWFEHMHGQRT